MKQRVMAAVLTAAIALGATAPALADGAASTRNIVLFGTAAALLITNYEHKLRARRAEHMETARRQSAYRDWYYHKFGYYPTNEQFVKWYVQTYGVKPS